MASEFVLYATVNSPFSHKVLVAAHELGLRDRLRFTHRETQPFAAAPLEPDLAFANPLGKIPVLVIPPSSASPTQSIFDSSVIIQYLDSIGDPARKILPDPSDATNRFAALTTEALGDGILDAAVLLVYEGRREEQSEAWKTSLKTKIKRGIVHLAKLPRPNADVTEPMPLAGIVAANVLWYIDRRLTGVITWREFEPVKRSGLVEWYDQVKQRASFIAEEFPLK